MAKVFKGINKQQGREVTSLEDIAHEVGRSGVLIITRKCEIKYSTTVIGDVKKVSFEYEFRRL